MGGVIISPVLLVCAVAVRWQGGPGVLFRQTRIGRDGRPFTILKLRTMRPGAPGAPITVAGDPRVTAVGRVLRRFKLDELPQLWNVLRGDMSLVGPRPELPEFVNQHAAGYRRLGRLRPGVTDWASLVYRDEETVLGRNAARPDYYGAVLLPQKLALARLYRRHASPGIDLRLMVATLLAACHLDRLVDVVAGRPVRQLRSAATHDAPHSQFTLPETTKR